MDTNRKPVIGMMRHANKPNKVVLAAAHAAKMINCEFFYFQPDKVNFNKKKILGQFCINGTWEEHETNFLDVIDNSPPKKQTKHIHDKLQSVIPFTTFRIGNKNSVNKRIFDDGQYSELVIPFESINSKREIDLFLDKYSKTVIKPKSSNRGRNIFYIERKD